MKRYTLREMFLVVTVAVLAVGWITDRFRLESIIKKEEQAEELMHRQLELISDAHRLQQEEINDLWKLIPQEQFRSVIEKHFQDRNTDSKKSRN
jgi:hypothetical protein